MAISENTTLFYNAKPAIFEKAKSLRINMTPAEEVLWERLKGKKMLGLRFRSQHPIDRFIADFYCHKLKLVIEVDGGIHGLKDQKEYDIGREAELSNLGIKVVRFSNDEVFTDLVDVVHEIRDVCLKRLDEVED